jgi:hypothetical protein
MISKYEAAVYIAQTLLRTRGQWFPNQVTEENINLAVDQAVTLVDAYAEPALRCSVAAELRMRAAESVA